MSWLQELFETYEVCAGREPSGSATLMPIAHTTQQAHIEIVLDEEGNFRRASVLSKGADATTMIPCTEKSGGRTGSKPDSHPLSDKLQYIAADFLAHGGVVTSGFSGSPAEPHRKFFELLSGWAASDPEQPKLKSILIYVQKGKVVEDLAASGIVPLNTEKKFLGTWDGDKHDMPPIFAVLPAGQMPQDVFIRWRVEGSSNPASGTWEDDGLIQSWIRYYQSMPSMQGFCMVKGEESTLSQQHPAKLRNAGDKAKLISANDNDGLTFRGRFTESAQAVGVGYEVTQKAHNALRWLIARQGARHGDQVVVSWSVKQLDVFDPDADSDALANTRDVLPGDPSAGQIFAQRLRKAVNGYRAKLDPTAFVNVLALDSATPGRMSITFYRHLKGSEFLDRIEAWHSRYAWHQNFGKERKFIGAPAPADIAQAAYGKRLDDKLEKATRERLLACVVDGSPFPHDLMETVVRRTSNRPGFKEWWEWEKNLGIACAIFRGFYIERNYGMALEKDRKTRDYLYGRLLAIADDLESYALFLADEKRETTAMRMMQRFADRPYATWRTIELSLQPYMPRIRARSPDALHRLRSQMDDIFVLFEEGQQQNDQPLKGEFLLGFHCQRAYLQAEKAEYAAKKKEAVSIAEKESV